MRQDSIGDPEQDPWGSPAPRRGTQAEESTASPRPNGALDSIAKPATNGLGHRTTSAFTTHSESPPTNSGAPADGPPGSSGAGGWDSYNGNRDSGFSQQPTLGGGFGSSGGDQGNSNPSGLGRSIAGSNRIPKSGDEVITITMLPEKEGMFLFQHRNYEVKSVRRGASVVRRYSDFVWLLDCLLKRYPFRQLPLLPPKRVAGTFAAADLWYNAILICASQWDAHRSRCQFIPREAASWTRAIHHRPCTTPYPEPRAARNYVFDCSDSKSYHMLSLHCGG